MNLCLNPEFRTDLTHWASSTPRIVLSRNTNPGVTLPVETIACCKLDAEVALLSYFWPVGNADNINFLPGLVPVAPASGYTFSSYVYLPAGGNYVHGVRLSVYWYDSSMVQIGYNYGSTLGVNFLTSATAGFQRLTLRNVNSTPTGAYAIPSVEWDTDSLADAIYFTANQFELGAVETAYDGGLSKPGFPTRFW